MGSGWAQTERVTFCLGLCAQLTVNVLSKCECVLVYRSGAELHALIIEEKRMR